MIFSPMLLFSSGYESKNLVILSVFLNALTLAVVVCASCGTYYRVRQYRLQTKHQEKGNTHFLLLIYCHMHSIMEKWLYNDYLFY